MTYHDLSGNGIVPSVGDITGVSIPQVADSVSLNKFGLSEDNTALVNTSKFQLALNRIASGDIDNLALPPGDFPIGELTFVAPAGSNAYMGEVGPALSGVHPRLSRLLYAGTGHCLTISGTVGDTTLIGNSTGTRIERLGIIGPSINDGVSCGVKISAHWGAVIDQCIIAEFGDTGVHINRDHYGDSGLDDHGAFVTIRNSEIKRCGLIGILGGGTFEADHVELINNFIGQHLDVAVKMWSHNFYARLCLIRGANKGLWIYQNNVSFANKCHTLENVRFENTQATWQLGIDGIQTFTARNCYFVGTGVTTMVKLAPTAGQTVASAAFDNCYYFADAGGTTTAFDLASADATSVVNRFSVTEPTWVGTFANKFLNAQSRRFYWREGYQHINAGAALPPVDYVGAAATDQVWRAVVSGDTTGRTNAFPGGFQFGAGGVTAIDVSISRTAADVLGLATGDSFAADRYKYRNLTGAPGSLADGDMFGADGSTYNPGGGIGTYLRQSAVIGKITTTTFGTAAPATTPASVGLHFLDTTNKKLYVSTGTASSADWTILN